MKRKLIVSSVIAAVLLASVFLAIGYYYWANYVWVHKTIEPINTHLSKYQVNAYPGEIFQINVTMHLFYNASERVYCPEVKLVKFGVYAWNSSQDSHKVYTATFNPKQVTLKEFSPTTPSVTSVLTMQISQEAQPGRYYFSLANSGFYVYVTSDPN